MPTNLKYGLGAGLLVFVLLLFSCNRQQVDLGGGYKLTRLSRYRVAVTETDRGDYPVISGNVEKYAASAPFILGYASTNHLRADTNIVSGYFVVNTDTRVVRQGLSEAQWQEALAEIHWRNPLLVTVP